MIKKLIEIEFGDDFIPPDRFQKSYELGDRSLNECEKCPFHMEDDVDEWCRLHEWGEIYHQTYITDRTCPIKKYFDEEK